MESERMTTAGTTDPFPMGWQRLVALAGIGFAVLFVVGFLLAGADTPDYTASNQEWTKWAVDNQTDNQISVLLILVAGYEFLLFAGSMRSVLGIAESAARGFTRVAHIAFAGAITGIAGIVMAIVMIGVASLQGSDTDATVARAVTQAAAGPFLLASVGFATLLVAAAFVTMRTGVFARWTAIVALIGGIAFLVTFLTATSTDEDTVFGVGFPIGFLCLVIWSIATSLENYRRLGTTAGAPAASGRPSGV
jgi:hypothetical protein